MLMGKGKVTIADAERLKRNSCYAIHECKSYYFTRTLRWMVWGAVLYHHFGMHDMCGTWCPWLRNKETPAELAKLYYHDKIKDKALYDQILENWVTYCLDDAL
jgi:fructose-1,6-bisphosphatase